MEDFLFSVALGLVGFLWWGCSQWGMDKKAWAVGLKKLPHQFLVWGYIAGVCLLFFVLLAILCVSLWLLYGHFSAMSEGEAQNLLLFLIFLAVISRIKA